MADKGRGTEDYMICGYCNQRFGEEGKNYYSIKIGVCPKCKEIDSRR